MEPTSERMRLPALPPVVDCTSRQILEHSLRVLAHHLEVKLGRTHSFWAKYDCKRGALLEVFPNNSLMVCRSMLADAGVMICYQVAKEVKPRTFYVSLDEKCDYSSNVKAFEMAMNLLVVPSKRTRKLKHVISCEAIDKLLRAKPRSYPDRFCHPDPLTLIIRSSWGQA